MSKPVLAARAFRALEDALDAGFTCLRDAGFTDYGFKRAIGEGWALGPRLRLATGPLSQTGGHSDFRTPEEAVPRISDGLYHPGLVVDGIAACRAAVREVLRRGADHVKVMASGGCTSPTDDVDHTQFRPDELAEVVAEARIQHTYVMAHAYTPGAILACVEAGVRSIEHANGVDEQAGAAMAAAGTYAVPTITTYELLARDGEAGGMPAEQITQVKKVLASAYEAVEVLQNAGVPIGSGSDVLGPHQGDRSRELVLKSRVLGPMGAIVAATRTNAELIGLGDDLGTVEPGKLADLILIDGNPLDSIDVLCARDRILLVILDGRAAVDRAGLATATTETSQQPGARQPQPLRFPSS